MGSPAEVQHSYSPYQEAAMQASMPAINRASGLASQGLGLYDVGPAPSAPTYNVVNPEMMMPTQQWWNSLSPNVKSGLYAPYQEVGQQLIETLGGRGAVGSPRAGYSGAAGAALGELGSNAARDVGMQAWQMTSPAMQTYWNTLQQREMFQPLSDYDMAKQVWQQDLISKNAAQQMAGGVFGQTVNNPAAIAVPTSASMIGRGIFSGIGGFMSGMQSGGTMGGIGGGISGFGQGYYGGGGAAGNRGYGY